jgi:RND family efflux transporter MFP subunit
MRLRVIRLLGSAVISLGVAAPVVAQATEIPVHTTRIDDRKAVFATVESVRRTLARARIGGTIGALAVSEGDRVQAGQKVAMVGDPKLAMQLDAGEQRVRSQQASRDQARSDFDRARALFASGTIAKARLDQAQTALQVAERALAASSAERAVSGQQITEGAVLAPVSGRVLAVPVSVGSVVLAGEAIAEIATESYILRARIPERHARFIRLGDPVSVGEHEIDSPLGLQGKTLSRSTPRQGRIVKVYPEIKDGRVTADIEVAGLDDYFVGERVRVWVSTGSRPGMVLPENAVSQRNGLRFVRLKDGGEVLVQTGRTGPGGIEILSGLKDGDVVVPQ